MITAVAIANYRSLRDIVFPLGRLNVVTGANGSGKSSLYRAIRLLADTALGRAIPSLAAEGGLASTLWAGPEQISRAMQRGEAAVEGSVRKKPVNLRLGFASASSYSYLVDFGLPSGGGLTMFALDPEIKRECVWHGPKRRPSVMIADRDGPVVRYLDGDRLLAKNLAPFDSMLLQLADPRGAPELLEVREAMRAWRFYDHFRTDAEAPARRTQIGTRTPVLSNDGSDLAAAIQTIVEIGDAKGMAAAVSDAFPGSSVRIERSEDARFRLTMRQPGLLRGLAASELSDGTLRYLLWVAALLSPRPPELVVLNEPETSLHPDLLPALSRLIGLAAERSQVIAVTHSPELAAGLAQCDGYRSIVLEKVLGETQVAGSGRLDRPPWEWPAR